MDLGLNVDKDQSTKKLVKQAVTRFFQIEIKAGLRNGERKRRYQRKNLTFLV
jgi:hypothetical protein